MKKRIYLTLKLSNLILELLSTGPCPFDIYSSCKWFTVRIDQNNDQTCNKMFKH